MKPFRQAFALVLQTPRLWVAQAVGNVVIFLLCIGWLRLSEAHWWDLLLNVIVIGLVVAGAVVLHGGTLNYYASAHSHGSLTITPEFRKALRHFFAIAVWAAVFFSLFLLLGKLEDYSYSAPGYLRSELPRWLRSHTTDEGFERTYTIIMDILVFVVLPGLLLPGARLAANYGFPGLFKLREWGRSLRNVSYWAVMMLAVIPAGILITLLLDWKVNPQTATLRLEAISLILRLVVCYAIGLFAWLWVCSMVGRVSRSGQAVGEP